MREPELLTGTIWGDFLMMVIVLIIFGVTLFRLL